MKYIKIEIFLFVLNSWKYQWAVISLIYVVKNWGDSPNKIQGLASDYQSMGFGKFMKCIGNRAEYVTNTALWF